ncbi:hypothetical protein, partial [Actinobacillus pleuropneumoniae]|uniref:hypothetical protein n=1 Tax=Actinobacillus pleuropneumoniae TaxID=715 RepID=UPI00227C1FFE
FEPSKTKEGKQPNKIKNKVVVTEPADINVPNPHQVTVEDITDTQPSVEQPRPPPSSKENSNSIPKSNPENAKPQVEISHNAD